MKKLNIKQYKINHIFEKIKKCKGTIKINSKEINKGDIFISLKGSKDHGEKYINDAIEKGAKLIITEKSISNNKKNIIQVENCLKFLDLMAIEMRSKYKGIIIAITGSVGKTSSKEQLKFFLNKKNNTYASIKSYNNKLGVSLSLANIDLKSKYAIFEIGTNNFGEIKLLTKLVNPNIAIVTNISPTHLENFKNVGNILKEKSEIFNSKNNTHLKFIIVPYENNLLLKKAKLNKKCKIISFGKINKSDIHLKKIKQINYKNFEVLLDIKRKRLKYIISASGEHQIMNNMISFAVFHALKLNISIIKQYAQYLPKLSGRGKIYKLKIGNKKIKLIDECYNASPLSMEATINYFKNYNQSISSNKILILGDMLELGKKTKFFHSQIYQNLINNNFYQIIVIGKHIKYLYENYKKNYENMYYFKDMVKLNKHILKYINNDDILLAKASNSSLLNKYITKIKKYKLI